MAMGNEIMTLIVHDNRRQKAVKENLRTQAAEKHLLQS